ncbi:MAG TPA: FN3 associated domain-containing protein, partial [Prolixibacteraceae bacterium]|nr:FN3 associated domain-containing protein [Prolixibacteraceae bacterium]
KVTSTTFVNPEEKNIEVRLMSELDRAEIHYTLDGSEPSTLSSIYAEPISINKSVILKATTFVNGMPAEQSMTRMFNINEATFKPVQYLVPAHTNYQGSGEVTLVNGMRGSTEHNDNQWQGWVDKRVEVIIDLKDTIEIKRIAVGTLLNIGAWIYPPRMIEYFVSTDGVQFQKVAEVVNEPEAPSPEALLKNYVATIVPVKACFVRIVAHNMGRVPAGHPGEGEPGWIFMDEIAVE